MKINCRGMCENCMRIDLFRGSPVVILHREILRERRNTLSNQLVCSSISNVELQSYIYRRLALMLLAHMA